MRRSRARTAMAGAALVLLAACQAQSEEPSVPAGLANPASAYCVEQGGQASIVEDPEGGQVGICAFVDGSECEEWAYYRGECAPGVESP